MGEQDKITLEVDKERFPQLLKRYSLEQIKDMAISMALKQYQERPITRSMLHSCLVNLEMDLERMFPPPKTAEQQAEDEAEAAEAEARYQEAIAEMEPYLVNGEQLMVNANGEEAKEGESSYPVWVNKNGELTARIYCEGWDWLFWREPEEDEEDD